MLSNFKGFFLEMSIWLGLNFATPLLLHEHAGDETPFLLRNFAPLPAFASKLGLSSSAPDSRNERGSAANPSWNTTPLAVSSASFIHR